VEPEPFPDEHKIGEYIERQGTRILVRIAVDRAVFDVVTDEKLLADCIRLLREPHLEPVSTRMGTFGGHSVTLNVLNDLAVSIFVDGPQFSPDEKQAIGIWCRKEEVERVLLEAVAKP